MLGCALALQLVPALVLVLAPHLEWELVQTRVKVWLAPLWVSVLAPSWVLVSAVESGLVLASMWALVLEPMWALVLAVESGLV